MTARRLIQSPKDSDYTKIIVVPLLKDTWQRTPDFSKDRIWQQIL